MGNTYTNEITNDADPGAERIINTGGKVYFAKDTLVFFAKLKEPEDRAEEPILKDVLDAPKKVRHPILLVTLKFLKTVYGLDDTG